MTILFLGYMGSGKSTLGRLAAKKWDYKFVDFDDLIEEGEGISIPEIFKTKGEIHFRKLESQYIDKVLQLENTIVSLGGGTPCYGNVMDRIKKSGASSVYINVPVKPLSDRLWKARSYRPVLQHQDTPEKLEEFVRKHLFERAFYYNQADHKVIYTGQSEDEMVKEIEDLLF